MALEGLENLSDDEAVSILLNEDTILNYKLTKPKIRYLD
jgi:hypothetical protein